MREGLPGLFATQAEQNQLAVLEAMSALSPLLLAVSATRRKRRRGTRRCSGHGRSTPARARGCGRASSGGGSRSFDLDEAGPRRCVAATAAGLAQQHRIDVHEPDEAPSAKLFASSSPVARLAMETTRVRSSSREWRSCSASEGVTMRSAWEFATGTALFVQATAIAPVPPAPGVALLCGCTSRRSAGP